MTALLIILAVLAALAYLKIGVYVSYAQENLLVQVRCLCIRITLVGGKAKKSHKKQKQKTKKEAPSEPKAQPKPKPMEMAKQFLPYWEEILGFCGRVLTAPTLDLIHLDLVVGGKDASSCALQYGRICAAVSAVLPVIENTFTVRNREISITNDYEKDSVEILAETKLSLRIYEILILVCGGLKLLLRIRRENKNTKKAVQTL